MCAHTVVVQSVKVWDDGVDAVVQALLRIPMACVRGPGLSPGSVSSLAACSCVLLGAVGDGSCT